MLGCAICKLACCRKKADQQELLVADPTDVVIDGRAQPNEEPIVDEPKAGTAPTGFFRNKIDQARNYLARPENKPLVGETFSIRND